MPDNEMPKPEEANALFAEWTQDQAAAEFRDEWADSAVSGQSNQTLFNDLEWEWMSEATKPTGVMTGMSVEERVRGFNALLDSKVGSTIHTQDQDGEYRTWGELSPAGKLAAVASDAAYYDLPAGAFIEAARERIGPQDLLEAGLRLAYDSQRELHAISRLLPDDHRLVPTPLPEQVQDVVAELKHAQRFIESQGHDMEM